MINDNTENKKIYVDIDGTLTFSPMIDNINEKTISEIKNILLNSKPRQKIIDIVNSLFCKNFITLYTARSDLYQKETLSWLKENNVKYHNIIFNKPFYDILIDDKTINVEELK